MQVMWSSFSGCDWILSLKEVELYLHQGYFVLVSYLLSHVNVDWSSYVCQRVFPLFGQKCVDDLDEMALWIKNST